VQRAKSLVPSPPVWLSSALAVVSTVLALGCGGAPAPGRAAEEHASHGAPADPRPGYCSADLPLWWPLTEAEAAALKGADRARKGDPEALLSLAIFASGNRRDAADYARYQERVRRFVAEVRPAIDQGRVTGIFDDGHYNCMSSTLLYLVLWLVSERIEQPLSNEQIAEALRIAGKLGDACKADGDCSQNVFAGVMNSSRDLFRQKKWAAGIERLASAAPWATNAKRQEDLRENQKAVFLSWAIEHQNAGDWPGARKVLEDCEAKVPGLCRDDLEGLESRHRF
jgi:hypothetical protein